jgi:hypothetical protein
LWISTFFLGVPILVGGILKFAHVMTPFDSVNYDVRPKSVFIVICPEVILYFSMFASLLPGVMAKKSYRFEERIK